MDFFMQYDCAQAWQFFGFSSINQLHADKQTVIIDLALAGKLKSMEVSYASCQVSLILVRQHLRVTVRMRPFFMGGRKTMHTYTVIGPVGGVYHVGFYGPAGQFFSAHEFVSKDLAHVTAQRMNQNLTFEANRGR